MTRNSVWLRSCSTWWCQSSFVAPDIAENFTGKRFLQEKAMKFLRFFLFFWLKNSWIGHKRDSSSECSCSSDIIYLMAILLHRCRCLSRDEKKVLLFTTITSERSHVAELKEQHLDEYCSCCFQLASRRCSKCDWMVYCNDQCRTLDEIFHQRKCQLYRQKSISDDLAIVRMILRLLCRLKIDGGKFDEDLVKIFHWLYEGVNRMIY